MNIDKRANVRLIFLMVMEYGTLITFFTERNELEIWGDHRNTYNKKEWMKKYAS